MREKQVQAVRRLGVVVSGPLVLAALACALVIVASIGEWDGWLPAYSSWLAMSMAAGYSISGSV